MQRLSLPEPLQHKVQVHLLTLDLQAPLADADWQLLDDGERRRAQAFWRHADRLRFAATRAALRRLLGQACGRDPRSLCFEAGPHGKPQLQGAGVATPAFNVAHAGRHALLALGHVDCLGVDIECCDAVADWTELAPQLLSPRERLQDPLARPTLPATWATKEAVLKAVGLGIGEHLGACSVLAAPAHAASPYELELPPHWPALSAWPLPVPHGHVAALAASPSFPLMLQDAA